ncbi:MAG: hypothetical protein ABIQ30_11195 [Devosia sp.]
MFLFRSAFWLVVGFLVVAPHGTDFGATAASLTNQALSAGVQAGEQLIVSQMTSTSRLPNLLLSASQSVDLPMNASAESSVFPRPRPAKLG